MIVHDDALLDAIAVFALGASPASEARELASHLASCADCRNEYASLRGAADAFGYEAEIAPNALDEMSARRLKSRVMSAVAASVRDAAPAISRDASPSSNGVVRGRTSWLPYGAAVAAALVAAVSLANNASLRHERGTAETRVAAVEASARDSAARASALQAQIGSLDARVATLVAPDSRHFPVASGEVVASGNRIVIALRGLPKLPPGKVYQAWTLANGAKAVAPSITFVPDASGVALVELPERAANLAAVAVSVEPVGGSKAPTSKPAFVRALS